MKGPVPGSYHHSDERKEKIRLSKLGKKRPNFCGINHPKWRGDDPIDTTSLHQWVRYHLPKPDLCEFCDVKPPHDLANITNVYNRDFENWKYLCHACHMRYDAMRRRLKRESIS